MPISSTRTIDMHRVVRLVFWTAVAIQVALVLGDYVFNYLDVAGDRSIRRIWNLAREESLPTWFSSIQAQLLGATVLLVAWREAGRIPRWQTVAWILIGLFFCWIGIDDYAQIHERLGGALERLARGRGRWSNPSFSWHTFLMPFFALCGLATMSFLATRFWRLRLLPYLVLGFGCWVVAQGLDFIEGVRGVDVFYRRIGSLLGIERYYGVTHGFKVLEETLEMFGTTLLWVGFLKYLSRAVDGLQLRFVDSGVRLSADTRRPSRDAWLVLVVLAWTCVSSRSAPAAPPDRPEFAALVPVPSYGDEQLIDLAGRVGTAIVHDRPLDLPASTTKAPAIVVISVSDGRMPARAAVAAGDTLTEAATAAVEQVPAWRAAGLAPRWVVVDVVDRVEPLEFREDGALALPADQWGIASDTGTALLPAELTARALVDSRGRLRAERVATYLTERGDASNPGVPQWRFTTRRYFSDGGDAHAVEHGRARDWAATPDTLLAAATLAGEHLVRIVKKNGTFIYDYDPVGDREGKGYSALRHAGTAYAMLELYAVTRSAPLLDAANRALAWLRTQIVPCGQLEGERCLAEGDSAKLGGNGLALVALAEYVRATGDRAPIAEMEGLARHIRAVQQPDGSFRPHEVDLRTGRASSQLSQYYPGEAMLGLLRVNAVAPSPELVASAAAAARYLDVGRDGTLDARRLPHDHWLLYALNELDQLQPEGGFDRHARKIADAILGAQRALDGERCCRTAFGGFVLAPPTWIGTFYTPPRSTPVATRCEGLAAAHAIAIRHGAGELAAGILAAMVAAAGYESRTQIGPATAMYFRRPGLVDGAFREGLTGFRLRNDFTQHNVSAFLGLRRALLATATPR